MGFFDDDPFEEIVREFFGGTPSRVSSNGQKIISGEDEERKIDFVETPKEFFIVFELQGYEKEDVSLEIVGNKLVVHAKKKQSEKMEDYMARKLFQGLEITKVLPKFIKTKNYKHTFRNGVLEIAFKK